MKFDLEKKDELNAVLHLDIQKEDYSDKVENTIRDLRKTMNVPGFRKGHVPISLIRNQHGKSILIDEINKILQEELNKYIQEQKLSLLGQPLPVEDNEIDWDSENFRFSFELGFAPEVNLAIDPSVDVLPWRRVDVTDDVVNEEIESLSRRHGQVDQVEEVGSNDFVRGSFVEEGAEHGHSHSAGFRLDDPSASKLLPLFEGAKKEEVRTIDVDEHFESKADAAKLLGMDEAHLAEHGSKFLFTIEGIVRVTPSEMNKEDLFSKVFPEVETEEEFRSKVKEQLEASFEADSRRMFENQMIEYLLDKVSIDLPDAFLKKWMITASESEEPMTEEKVEQEYPSMSKGLRWQLIENAISQTEEVKVEKEDMDNEAKEQVREQMAAYGQSMLDDKLIDSIAQNYLNDSDHVQRLYERARQRKVLAILAEKFGKEVTLLSTDEFYTQQS